MPGHDEAPQEASQKEKDRPQMAGLFLPET
jgi:hypothetical protein